MHVKDWLIICVCVILGGVLLTFASMRLDTIQQAREDMGLVANTSLENAPPSLAFATVAMGAFRGLVVDILWMRADTLKQEGKFFDAKQLAEWITLLQPRFAQVWDFHAWNMAYNISVAIPNTQPEQRWHWVKNGYELLRDRGIEMNPHNIMLYRSLAWIFQHKIGDMADDCHRYYKKELALSVRGVLGPDPTNEYFIRLAQSPATLDEISETNEGILTFITDLQNADAVFTDKQKLIDNYLSLRQTPKRFSPQAHEVINQYRDSETLEIFDTFAKAFKLRNEWKFDIDFMIKLNHQYGRVGITDPNEKIPLNWEHPAAHAIYWAARGLEVAGRPDQYRIDEKNTDRVIYHSLQMLFRTGKIIIYESPGYESELFLAPDPQMFDSCDKTWLNKIAKYEELEGNPKAVRGGHKNLLEDAVLYFYQAGQEKTALGLYERLRKEHKMDQTGFFERDEYKVPFLTFVKNRWREEFEGLGLKDASQMIYTLLQDSYYQYALHEDDAAAVRENFAREIYEKYQKEMGAQEQERVGLVSMDKMRFLGLGQFLENPMLPEHLRMSLLGRIKVERPDLYEKFRDLMLEEIKKYQNQESIPPR